VNLGVLQVLALLLTCQLAATAFYRRTRGFPLAHPVLLSVTLIAALLEFGHTGWCAVR
jgi:hypothetical protein